MTRLNQTLTPALTAIYLFLSNAVIPVAAQPAANPSRTVPSVVASRPFLWKVDGPAPSWLFGTIHSDDPTVAILPHAVTAALDASRSFHPEVEASAELGAEVVAKLFGADGPDLSTRLSPALWTRVRRTGDSLGLPDPILERLTPAFAALLFSAPENTDISATVDGQLHDRAATRGLAIAPLETVAEQLGLFEKLSEPQAIAALVDALDEIDAGRPTTRKLLAAYASGDEQKIIAVVAAEFAASPAARSLAEPLLYRRNQAMADRLAAPLKAGGAFVAVGVAHLTGPRSVIELLRARGWKIARVAL